MEELMRFISLAQTDRFTITDLCEQFGISRKTAYKHLDRYAAGGWKALEACSHRSHRSPERTDEAVQELVLAERRLDRTWGAKEIQDILLKTGPEGRFDTACWLRQVQQAMPVDKLVE